MQNNISFNDAVGTTRGIHAEPWDKWVSVATGRIFGAWVDLREGPTFGAVFTAELDPSRAIFVPRGVGNSYQTLEPDTAYTYLVNDHWSPDAHVHVPQPRRRDRGHRLADPAGRRRDLREGSPRTRGWRTSTPVPPRKILVLGADGQLGRALRAEFGDAAHVEYADRGRARSRRPRPRDSRAAGATTTTIINAAAYTAVDAAETAEGRRDAWAANVTARRRARAASPPRTASPSCTSRATTSSTARSTGAYREDDAVCPLGVYGQTKAAGDALVATVPRHYIVRTSWVIGDGANFVRTMASLAERGIDPKVVDDQIGRLTFTDDLARGIRHLLDGGAAVRRLQPHRRGRARVVGARSPGGSSRSRGTTRSA